MPENAIKMTDAYGFSYPVINQELCIDCGLFAKKCPFSKPKKTESNCIESYAVKNKDTDVINNSSSGGFLPQHRTIFFQSTAILSERILTAI